MLYIGVDLGTSAVKLLLMDETGKVLKIVSREYPISFPKPGWSEQKPVRIYRKHSICRLYSTKNLMGQSK